MKRRGFIAGLAIAVAAWPLVAVAQQPGGQPLISEDKIKALEALALTNPDTAKVGEYIAGPLGLAPPGALFVNKQLNFTDDKGKHIFGADPNGSAKFIVYLRAPALVTIYVINRRGELLAAGKIVDNKFSTTTLAAARPGFAIEAALWNAKPLPDLL